MRIFSFFILLFFVYSATAQKYTPIHSSLIGDDLLAALVQDYKTDVVLSYGDARDVMYGDIDLRNDSVECVYSGHQVYLASGEDPSQFVFMNGDNNGINAEHVYPRSKGADFGNPLADMHHIFPCRVGVNTNRGSYPFAEINDQETESWYRFTSELNSIPTSQIDSYSEGIRGIDGFFEPRESRKGDIARAVFYFYTMYRSEANAADPNFFAEQMNTLCQWHEQDPVDAIEYARTFKIAAFQDDNPNPFILDCSLVERAYCQNVQIECPDLPIINSVSNSQETEYIFFPNPVEDVLFLKGAGEMKVTIYDVLGQPLLQEQIFDNGNLSTESLTPGSYLIQVNQQVYKLIK